MRLPPALALAAVAALAFAGCAASNEPGTTGPSTPAPAAPSDAAITFAAPLVLGDVPLGSEPSIAPSGDGRVYVTSPASSLRSAVFPPSPPLWRSDDGGATYTFLGQPSCALDLPTCPHVVADDGRPDLDGPGDAEIAATPDGVVHWAGLFGQSGTVPYQRSTDHGGNWSEPTPLADGNSDREWLTARADGALFASWRSFPDSGAAELLVRVTLDSGITWSPAIHAAPDGTAGPVAVQNGGHVVLLPYFTPDGIDVARSADDGANWTAIHAADGPSRGHIFPIAAIDTAGTAYLVWAMDPDAAVADPGTLSTYGAQSPSVFLARSPDAGLTWGKPVQLNAPGTTAIFPWVAAGAPGRIVVVWYDNPLGTPVRVGGPWQVMAAIATDADAEAPHFTLVQVTQEPIRVGGICTEGGACLTDGGDRTLLDFFEVDIHPAGHPVLVWAQDGQVPRERIDIAVSRMTAGPDLLEGVHATMPAPRP